jgi:hypothetical protein
LKVYLNLTAFLVWFIQSGHRNPTVAASAATGKISVRTTDQDELRLQGVNSYILLMHVC